MGAGAEFQAGKGHMCKPRSGSQAVRPSHSVKRAPDTLYQIRLLLHAVRKQPSDFFEALGGKTAWRDATGALDLMQGSLPKVSSRTAGSTPPALRRGRVSAAEDPGWGWECARFIIERPSAGKTQEVWRAAARRARRLPCQGAHTLSFRKCRSVHVTDQYISSTNQEPGQC